jgi:hypothetical protein
VRSKEPETFETFKRGVSPSLLVSQVQNTVPYLFKRRQDGGFEYDTQASNRSHLKRLQLQFQESDEGRPLSHSEYYALCVSAHWASCGSFVPTDVDNQIRFRLWSPLVPAEEVEKMALLVLEAYDWDFRALCMRYATSPSGLVLGGHQGEWLSIAVGAYAATRKCLPQLAEKLAEKINYEVTRHARVYAELKKAKNGIELLKATAQIAHNLGDLDRVIDLWGLAVGDPVYDYCYKSGHSEGNREGNQATVNLAGDYLVESGKLYQAMLAAENHRHFALREPRCLRQSADFLLPVAPFFDEWGQRLARNPMLSAKDLGEVVACLYQGWERLKGPQGTTITYSYPRAVSAILEFMPGGMKSLSSELPSRIEREIKSGLFRSLVTIPRQRFEEQWAAKALAFIRA